MTILGKGIFLFIFVWNVLDGCVTSDTRPNWSLQPISSHKTSSSSRVTRDVSLSERSNCEGSGNDPPTRVNTGERIEQLIQLMMSQNIDAYIIPTADEHQSEYVSDYDKRRAYISGFSGSAGTAVVLSKGDSALWTDGRYFLQADDQLDCSWLLMKEGIDGVPTIIEWLKQNLPEGSTVGADPRLVNAMEWLDYEKGLKDSAIAFMPIKTNLIDEIWPSSERKPLSNNPIEILELQYAGKKWEDKIKDIREEMVKHGADMIIITALDEVAWLFNLRGLDIPNNPVFRSYAIIDKEKIRLFLDRKISAEVDLHLRVNQFDQERVELYNYKNILESVNGLTSSNAIKKVILPSQYSYTGGASYAIYSSVPEEKRMQMPSPALFMKARKNPVEIEGMKNAHVKDGVALIDFLSFMESEIRAGNSWNEITAAKRLYEFRAEQEDFRGLSFETISAFGSNGAIVHYVPTNETNKPITDQSLYLLDSGGQYKDGTTDVTRTLHYGEPTVFQKESYTRVLKGAIDVALLTFPKGTKDTRVDVLARKSLYEVGLDYKHGTGHGIGMYLSIHEAPIQMRIYGKEEHELEEGHFLSDEPGYYKDGEFGIRLETILTVVSRITKYKSDVPMLGFEPVTLVPFEPKLIDVPLLERRQCEFLNAYHARVRQVIGPELDKQQRTRAKTFMMEKTGPISCVNSGTENEEEILETNQISRMNLAAMQSKDSNFNGSVKLGLSYMTLLFAFLFSGVIRR